MRPKNTEAQCPVCHNPIAFSARYGNYICNDCIDLGTFTEDGRRVRHGNISHSGGFESLIEGETVKGHEHYCYIEREGIRYKLYADEARFGGIVYLLANNQD
tara:strand:- start:123 stop:428 length:306 start_codon:yes stop_codon:yes gene_type:complete